MAQCPPPKYAPEYYSLLLIEIQFFGKPDQSQYEHYWLVCGRIIKIIVAI